MVAFKKNNSKSGQAITEYILLLSIILGFVFGFSKAISSAFNRGTTGFGSKIEARLLTGRGNLKLWEN
jgi:hypothetical protein